LFVISKFSPEKGQSRNSSWWIPGLFYLATYLKSCTVLNVFVFLKIGCCLTADSTQVAQAEAGKSLAELLLEERENQRLKRNDC